MDVGPQPERGRVRTRVLLWVWAGAVRAFPSVFTAVPVPAQDTEARDVCGLDADPPAVPSARALSPVCSPPPGCDSGAHTARHHRPCRR